MRVEPLYRLSFRYSGIWDAQDIRLLRGEGRCEGRVSGAFAGVNRAHRRVDGSFEPDYDAVIETDDGAAILWHLTGYGWPAEGRVVATVKHLCDHGAYGWLNDVLCAANGVVKRREVVLDVSELVWEPPGGVAETTGAAGEHAGARYMVIENFVEGARPVYERAAAKGRMLPPGVVYLDSWIDERLHRCFQLVETDDPSLLDTWTARWGDLIRFEIVPLIGSSDAAARALDADAAS